MTTLEIHVPPAAPIAQTADPALSLLQSIALPLLGLVVAIVAGWFAISFIRRWMRPDDGGSAGFTLDDLRRLHRAGEMTDAEYERARDALIGSVRGSRDAGARVPPPKAGTSDAQRPAAPTRGAPADEPRRPIRPPGLDRPD